MKGFSPIPGTFFKSRRLGLAVIMLLFLQACSSTTFVYKRLDFILPWYLDDYVDLNRDQRASLDTLLQPFLHWHRVEELPRYVQILAEIEQSLDHRVTPEVIGQTFSELERAWLRLEEEVLGWTFALGAELSDEQIEEFLIVLREQQSEYEQEYLHRSDEEYLEDSYDNFLDGIQDYLGRLDKGQRASLRQASSELQRMDVLWLEERATWLVNMGALLEREPGWQQKLRDLRDAREDNHSPQYSEMYAHNLEVIKGAIATVLNSRSEKQDRRLRKKIRNLRQDFGTLIAQANPGKGQL